MPKKIDKDCVIKGLEAGLRFSEIARRCGCSERTVRRIAKSLAGEVREDVLVLDVEPKEPRPAKKEPAKGVDGDKGGKEVPSIWELILEI